MKKLLFLLAAGLILAVAGVQGPEKSFAQSATKARTYAKVPSANLFVVRSASRFDGDIYAESSVVVDSGQSIKFKASATGEVASTAPIIRTGAGTPLNVISAPVGSIFLRTDGSTSTTLYVKTAGTDSAGWTAK